jgi:hypothetical protein
MFLGVFHLVDAKWLQLLVGRLGCR